MNNDLGFIKLNRRFFANILWKEARTFSRCEAWLDMIQSARFDAWSQSETVGVGGREVNLERGQWVASLSFLSKRWGWKTMKVRTFLAYLKKEKMISVESVNGISVITLLNYETYNSSDSEKTPDNTVDNTLNSIDIMQSISELRTQVAQLVAQMIARTPENITQQQQEEKEYNNKISPVGDTKEAAVFDSFATQLCDTPAGDLWREALQRQHGITDCHAAVQLFRDDVILKGEIGQITTLGEFQRWFNYRIPELLRKSRETKALNPEGTVEERKRKLWDEIKAASRRLVDDAGVALFDKESTEAFYFYWSEPTPDGTRLRFELEKAWSTLNRMKLWIARDRR